MSTNADTLTDTHLIGALKTYEKTQNPSKIKNNTMITFDGAQVEETRLERFSIFSLWRTVQTRNNLEVEKDA